MTNDTKINISLTFGQLKDILIALDNDPYKINDIIKPIILDKLDKMVKHELYTTYKTTTDPAEREKARKEYLDKVGIPSDFRW